jgi:hypothetical protein
MRSERDQIRGDSKATPPDALPTPFWRNASSARPTAKKLEILCVISMRKSVATLCLAIKASQPAFSSNDDLSNQRQVVEEAVTMAIWRLTPIDLADTNWEASSHRGVAIVRAPDEEGARDAAKNAFGVKTRFQLGAGVKAPPWKRASVVKAEMIDDPRYELDGPAEVLEPSI